jgi:microcin C transport system substrate-binding protein
MRFFTLFCSVICAGFVAATPCFAAHAYAQFGDIKYAKGFDHFDYVNPSAPKGGEISLVSPASSSSFDKYNPFTLKGTAPPGLDGLVFETLLTSNYEEPTTAYGLLAEDVSVAADKLSATFTLNPLARFHNGTPVSAADVKYAFDKLISKEAAPQFRSIFTDVKGATVVSERVVRFEFKRVNAELPLIVGNLPVFSRAWGGGKALDKIVTDTPIGSGPYKIGKVDFGREFSTLETQVTGHETWGFVGDSLILTVFSLNFIKTTQLNSKPSKRVSLITFSALSQGNGRGLIKAKRLMMDA